MDGDQAMTKMQEMLDWAWEKHREKIFGVHGEYPIDAYVHFAAGYEAAGEPQSPPVSQGAIAQVLMDEGYVHLNSFELADIILKNWDVKSLPDTRPDRKCK
jgi:hypothetical protein